MDFGRILAVSCLVLLAAPSAALAGPAEPGTTSEPPPCTLKAGATHTVVAVIDAETLELDDGSEVRLAGILAPSPPAFVTADAVWPPDRQAREALKGLLLGENVELAFAEPQRDRWNRLVAHVFVVDAAGQREWVQGWLLRAGHARVEPLPGDASCVSEMLAHERQAMAADLGLWRNPAYRIRWADQPQRLMRLRNTFQLIEGTVRKVALTRGRAYVNFGDDWRSDFTAGVSRRSAVFGAAAIAKLQALEGKHVRIRGWIERRNGPYVELFHPLQIEAVGDDALPPAAGIAGGKAPGGDTRVPAQAQPDPPTKKRPEHEVPGALDL